MTSRLLVAALCAAALVPAAHARARPWTLDDMLAVRAVSDPRVSPDGRFVAYVVRELDAERTEYRTGLWLASVATGASRRLAGSPASDDTPRWSHDGRWIAFLSARTRAGHTGEAAADEGRRQVWLVRPDSGEAAPLTDARGGVSAFEWSADDRFVAFLSYEPTSDERLKRGREHDDAWTPSMNYGWSRLWTIDVATRRAVQLTSGEFHVTSFSIAPNGARIVVSAQPTPLLSDMFRSDVWLVPATGGAPVALVRQKGPDLLPRFSPDGRWIAFVSADGRDEEWWTNNYLCVVSAAGGRPANLTGKFDEVASDVATSVPPVWTPDGEGLLFVAAWRTDVRVFEAFADGRAVQPFTRAPGVDGSPSLSADGTVVAFAHEDGEHARDVWIVRHANEEAPPERLTDANPQARELPAFRKQVITWPGADGRQVEGLLLSPAIAPAGTRAPLVLNLHGGPAGTHSQTFSAGSPVYAWPLFLQAGWAVLLPNPRGSGGYGEAFRGANVRDWGGKDAEDVLSGVDALVRLGLVDSTRLAVCGWSYGGFLTAALVTKTHRFRAAVVGAGVTDEGAMVGTSDIPEFDRSYFGAWPWEEPRAYVDRSPVYHAGNVTTPTSFVHGGADDRVPTNQSWEMYTALRLRGVPTDLLVLPREPHIPHEPKHLRAAMQWHLDWLTRWTLGDAAGQAATPAPTGAAHPRGAKR